MWRDPIVAEVRRIREEIAAECDHDLAKILKYLRSREKEYANRLRPPEKQHTTALAVAEDKPPYGE